MTDLTYLATLTDTETNVTFNYFEGEDETVVRINEDFTEIIQSAYWSTDILSDDLNRPEMSIDELKKNLAPYFLETLGWMNEDGQYQAAIDKVNDYLA